MVRNLCVAAQFLVLEIALALPLQAATLKAGVAKADITPPVGQPMYGYGSRKSPSTSTLDPLYARVLVLDVNGKRLALVTLDLGRVFGPASLERIKTIAGNSSSHLLIVASHTHSGPAIHDDYVSGVPAWETAATEKVGKAVQEAATHLAEARLGTGYGTAYIGHNRLRVNPDGTVSWFETNLTHVPTAPVDPTVSVLRVDNVDGKPLAVLVDYACHPVVFGSDNLQYSADYPGVMARTVESAFGGGPLCFFLQGAPGDINPYYAVTPLPQDALRRLQWTGETLGKEAARVAKDIHTEADAEPSLQFSQDWLSFRLRWNPEKWRQAIVSAFGADDVETSKLKPELQLPVTTVLLNKRIAFVGMPGEPFVDYQIAWRDRCPVRDALFLGYANGDYGYFPTIRAASLGGYGAGNSATYVEVGAGDRMLDHALVRIYEMLGRLVDLPEELRK